MNLNIFVSNKCFIYCRGCYSYSREEKCNKLLETDKIVDFLKYAYSKGIRKVTLCGGDPLAREDIIYLIKKINKICRKSIVNIKVILFYTLKIRYFEIIIKIYKINKDVIS